MMQKDYIMRIVEQFVQALLAIMKARKSGKHEEALERIQTASRFYLKTDMNLLLFYSPGQLLENFKKDPEQCIVCAELLNEWAEVQAAQKREDEALRLKTLSLHLFAAAIPKDKQFQVAGYLEKADALIEELREKDIPHEVVENVRLYEQFALRNGLKKRKE